MRKDGRQAVGKPGQRPFVSFGPLGLPVGHRGCALNERIVPLSRKTFVHTPTSDLKVGNSASCFFAAAKTKAAELRSGRLGN